MSTAFRPRSAAEIADAAIQLTRRHASQFFLLAAAIAIPSLALGLVNARLAPSLQTPNPQLGELLFVLPLGIVGTCWFFVSFGALVAAAEAAYLGEPPDPGACFRRALPRAGALIGGILLSYLLGVVAFTAAGIAAAIAVALFRASVVGVILATVLVIAGVVWGLHVFARYMVVTPAVLTERLGALAALRRSSELSRGYAGRSLGLLLVFTIILVIILVTAFALFAAMISNQQLVSVLSNLVLFPLYPVGACLVTVLYYDLRIRKEGYDIELMARQMEAGAGAGAAERAAY